MKFGELITEELPGKWHKLKLPMTVDIRPEFTHLHDDPILVIPESFLTDFASMHFLPTFLARDTEKPAVLHDYHYRFKDFCGNCDIPISRSVADKIFHTGLKAEGVSAIRRGIIWAFVRIFSGFAWNKYKGD